MALDKLIAVLVPRNHVRQLPAWCGTGDLHMCAGGLMLAHKPDPLCRSVMYIHCVRVQPLRKDDLSKGKVSYDFQRICRCCFTEGFRCSRITPKHHLGTFHTVLYVQNLSTALRANSILPAVMPRPDDWSMQPGGCSGISTLWLVTLSQTGQGVLPPIARLCLYRLCTCL